MGVLTTCTYIIINKSDCCSINNLQSHVPWEGSSFFPSAPPLSSSFLRMVGFGRGLGAGAGLGVDLVGCGDSCLAVSVGLGEADGDTFPSSGDSL